MLKVTCHGGVGEVGGNKVLLEDGDSALFLDFGKSFGQLGGYFDEFLQPRTNSCLRDLLTLGVLPSLDGIYRHDLLTHAGVWPLLVQRGLPADARRLFERDLQSCESYKSRHGRARVEGILISHCHTDHCQDLAFVDPSIPVYASRVTLAALQVAEEVSHSRYDSDLCKCRQRTVSVTGASTVFPGELEIETDNPLDRDLRPLELEREMEIGGFRVTALPVDHSVPGACAFVVVTPSGKKVFYSGDLRFHGRFSEGAGSITERLRDRTEGLRPDVVITEGTRVADEVADGERDVQRHLIDAVSACRGLAIVDFGWKDTTRVQTLVNVAQATGRVLAVNPKVAYLASRLHAIDPECCPNLAALPNVRVYLKRTDSMAYSLADYVRYKHLVGVCADWGNRSQGMRQAYATGSQMYLRPRLCHYWDGVRAYDLARDPTQYILHAGFFEANELLDVSPPLGSRFIRAATEPFCDEMLLDERKLANWLAAFGIDGGTDDGGVQHSHVSGHASGPELFDLIHAMKPRMVVPIHTEQPERFAEALGRLYQVTIPVLGQAIEID